jgi:ABC-2 type transport system ATP-binding protein
MQEYAGKKLITLSKGNQQKIQLVAALIAQPELIILDEPFSGLDPVNASLLKDVVQELIREGKIVLFSSHQMNYVEEFCDSIAILHQGKIVLSGRIRDIKRSYDRSVISVRSVQNDAIVNFCAVRLGDIVDKTHRKKDELIISLRGPEQKNKLIEALAAQNFDLDSIGVYEPTLEDIFVQYPATIRRQEREHETVKDGI